MSPYLLYILFVCRWLSHIIWLRSPFHIKNVKNVDLNKIVIEFECDVLCLILSDTPKYTSFQKRKFYKLVSLITLTGHSESNKLRFIFDDILSNVRTNSFHKFYFFNISLEGILNNCRVHLWNINRLWMWLWYGIRNKTESDNRNVKRFVLTSVIDHNHQTISSLGDLIMFNPSQKHKLIPQICLN